MTPTPESLAKPKAIEKVQPGQWWLGEYEDGQFWCECNARLTFTHSQNGSKAIELRGIGVDSEGNFSATLRQVRDFVVPTLTAAQAKKCGLEIK
jgi:hypothetical protein